MTTVKIRFRQSRYEEVDLERLSPRARAMAEAIAATTLSTASTIWVESDRPIRDLIPEWATYYSEEEAAEPLRRPWSGWDARRGDTDPGPHEWLERHAAKIPAGWHILGADPHHPVTHAHGMTVDQVLATLAMHGRTIDRKTWSAYVARDQAPKPADRVGREPLWDPADILTWLDR